MANEALTRSLSLERVGNFVDGYAQLLTRRLDGLFTETGNRVMNIQNIGRA